MLKKFPKPIHTNKQTKIGLRYQITNLELNLSACPKQLLKVLCMYAEGDECYFQKRLLKANKLL